MTRPVLHWSPLPRPKCKTPDCKRVEYRSGLCRECWCRERARLVFGRAAR